MEEVAFSKGLENVGASLVALMVKNLPAMQETCVQSLGWEDHLEKEKATHSSGTSTVKNVAQTSVKNIEKHN